MARVRQAPRSIPLPQADAYRDASGELDADAFYRAECEWVTAVREWAVAISLPHRFAGEIIRVQHGDKWARYIIATTTPGIVKLIPVLTSDGCRDTDFEARADSNEIRRLIASAHRGGTTLTRGAL